LHSTISVDILIPYYKQFEYFQIALESAMNQTHRNLQIIVLDDASNCIKFNNLMQNLGDVRITVIRNEINQGICQSFQKLLDASSSSYLVFLGQDDYLQSTYVEEMVWNAQYFPDVAFIVPNVSVIDKDGNIFEPLPDRIKRLLKALCIIFSKKVSIEGNTYYLVKGPSSIIFLLIGNFLYFPSIFFPRKSVGEFNFRNDSPITLDFDLILTILEKNSTFLISESKLAKYRRHEESLSGLSSSYPSRLKEEKLFYRNRAEGYLQKKQFLFYALARLNLTLNLHILYRFFTPRISLSFGLFKSFNFRDHGKERKKMG
jgi:glycosyltransferase involved in cell wall biosynthesis